MIEADLRTYLLTKPGVTAFAGDRIRPDQLDEADVKPAIIIAVDEEEPQNDLDGDGGLVKATVAIASLAVRRSDSRQLAEQVRLALAGYSGTAGSSTIRSIFDSSVTVYSPKDDGSDEGFFSTEQQYTVWYSETVPFS